MVFKFFIIIFSVILFTSGCGKHAGPKPGKVRIKFSSDQVHGLESDPTSNSQINCAGVMAHYPEQPAGFFPATCTRSNNTVDNYHEASFFPVLLSGGSGVIEMDVQIGDNREFILYGFKSSDNCTGQPGDSNNSSPFYLGSTTTNIDATTTNVNLTAETFNSDNKYSSCTGQLSFSGGGGSSGNLKIFTTSSPFDGSMTPPLTEMPSGIPTADSRCQTEGGSTDYKALLVDGSNRVACTNANCASGTSGRTDWVLQANTTYYRSDGVTAIGTTDANGLFTTTLTNTIDAITLAPKQVWTGLNITGGNEWMAGADCANWTDGSTGFGSYGYSGTTDVASAFYNQNNGSCSAAASFHLICVEQPPSGPVDNGANLQFVASYDTDGLNIDVNWTAFTDANLSDHKLFTYTDSGCTTGEVDHGFTGSTANSNNTNITGLAEGTYYGKVEAFNSSALSTTSACSTDALIVDTQAPIDNGANLQFTDANDVDGNDVAVTWTAFTDTSLVNHRIRTYTDSGCTTGETIHALTGSNSNSDSSSVDGLSNGTYYGKVEAFDGPGRSTMSACSTDSIVIGVVEPACPSHSYTHSLGSGNRTGTSISLANSSPVDALNSTTWIDGNLANGASNINANTMVNHYVQIDMGKNVKMDKLRYNYQQTWSGTPSSTGGSFKIQASTDGTTFNDISGTYNMPGGSSTGNTQVEMVVNAGEENNFYAHFRLVILAVPDHVQSNENELEFSLCE